MKDLIGIPQAASILGLTRQMTHLLYTSGKLQAVTTTGTEERPRPLFLRSHIESIAKSRTAEKAASLAG